MSDLEQEQTNERVERFMNILEQIPRLCSPTICGTLSQPVTRAERSEMFEWSIEQKAILSPANITTDIDHWQPDVAQLNPSWRQQESEMFFSQKTIAPSPLVATPVRVFRKPLTKPTASTILDEEDEDVEVEKIEVDDDDDDDEDDNDDESFGIVEDHDELFFSPEPIKSSQRMDVFSPDSFVRVMEDENTLQSTPKTTGSQRAERTRNMSYDHIM